MELTVGQRASLDAMKGQPFYATTPGVGAEHRTEARGQGVDHLLVVRGNNGEMTLRWQHPVAPPGDPKDMIGQERDIVVSGVVEAWANDPASPAPPTLLVRGDAGWARVEYWPEMSNQERFDREQAAARRDQEARAAAQQKATAIRDMRSKPRTTVAQTNDLINALVDLLIPPSPPGPPTA